MQLYAPLGNFRANKIQVASEILNVLVTNNYVDMKSIYPIFPSIFNIKYF